MTAIFGKYKQKVKSSKELKEVNLDPQFVKLKEVPRNGGGRTKQTARKSVGYAAPRKMILAYKPTKSRGKSSKSRVSCKKACKKKAAPVASPAKKLLGYGKVGAKRCASPLNFSKVETNSKEEESKSNSGLDSFIAHQNFNGSLTQSAFLKAYLPARQAMPKDPKILTLVFLAILKKFFKTEETKWRLVARKALQWLNGFKSKEADKLIALL